MNRPKSESEREGERQGRRKKRAQDNDSVDRPYKRKHNRFRIAIRKGYKVDKLMIGNNEDIHSFKSPINGKCRELMITETKKTMMTTMMTKYLSSLSTEFRISL